MDQRSRFICLNQTDSRKLLFLLGIAFGLVMVLQFFELPYDTMLSSLLSVGKVSFSGKSVSSESSDEKRDISLSGYSLHKNDSFSLSDQNVSSSSPSMALTPSYTVPSSPRSFNLNSIPPTTSMGAYIVKQRLPQSNLSAYNQTRNSSVKGNLEKPVYSISEMNKLLQQRYAFPQSSISRWHSNIDDELLQAKAEIMNAPVRPDGDLYGPLYHNVSISYELMEQKLKVYIYMDGQEPIFHSSILEGIYASEGWFLRLLEANRHFVTEVASEAHLFFLPFSSRLLELTLYVPHSHSRQNLIDYMKNYVDLLIGKYPFWNRTNGEDHFLAACHDWAPAETRGKMLNCIRGLCNADIRTGFVIGKDVSLPTTYVRSSRNPRNDIGGEPSSRRPILAFFAGYMHGRVRPLLVKYWGKDPDMKIVDRLPRVKGNKNYVDLMKSSKYCICARGFAVHSPRVVESIFYECVPVIVSDNYVPPFLEVLNWESFAVFILEKDVPNMKSILLSIPEEKYLEMKRAVKEVQKHFLWHDEPAKYDLFHMILHSVWVLIATMIAAMLTTVRRALGKSSLATKRGVSLHERPVYRYSHSSFFQYRVDCCCFSGEKRTGMIEKSLSGSQGQLPSKPNTRFGRALSAKR
nr:probable glycosyltransferase At5g03795 [Ipomoea batatas]